MKYERLGHFFTPSWGFESEDYNIAKNKLSGYGNQAGRNAQKVIVELTKELKKNTTATTRNSDQTPNAGLKNNSEQQQ